MGGENISVTRGVVSRRGGPDVLGRVEGGGQGVDLENVHGSTGASSLGLSSDKGYGGYELQRICCKRRNIRAHC